MFFADTVAGAADIVITPFVGMVVLIVGEADRIKNQVIMDTLQIEADEIQSELQQEEKKGVDVKRFLAIAKKYTDLTELTPEILREFIDKIIVHAPDKSSGRRLQEIEIIYNHIGEFDRSKVTLWKGNAV